MTDAAAFGGRREAAERAAHARRAEPASVLECHACGWRPPASEPHPFRCARADSGDGADHVLVRRVDARAARFDHADAAHPFVRHREMLHAYWRARAGGLPDAWFAETVARLDRAVASVAGVGFRPTPLRFEEMLSERLGFSGRGGVWVKDETANVSGSHKARHLFGLALHLEVSEALGLVTREENDRRGLAIASCGNAALAAAVVARACGRPIEVFVPPDAHPAVIERLGELGARMTVCRRAAGVPGDPCVRRFRDAVRAGAIPFCVQGPENGLALEGGQTLGWELAAQLDERGVHPDRILIQVGGGAFAASCAAGLAEAVEHGALEGEPRLHAVQTEGCWPLRRAWLALHARAARAETVPPGAATDFDLGPEPYGSESWEAEEALARERDAARDARRAAALDAARRDRAAFMRPWDEVPHSAAHGILDDETYDFVPVTAAMLRTRGYPLVVNEAQIAMAWSLVRETTHVRADATGTAGVAGLLALRAAGVLGVEERVVVVLSGAERG
uniref:Pyridoxal-phosphate dependent enzyme n=1 Tax=Eiseniibacteriota bacterium TaxID=2212470 RepID=A0A832MNI1_UNCEI